MTIAGEQNDLDLISIVGEINRVFAESLSFVYIPGDVAEGPILGMIANYPPPMSRLGAIPLRVAAFTSLYRPLRQLARQLAPNQLTFLGVCRCSDEDERQGERTRRSSFKIEALDVRTAAPFCQVLLRFTLGPPMSPLEA